MHFMFCMEYWLIKRATLPLLLPRSQPYGLRYFIYWKRIETGTKTLRRKLLSVWTTELKSKNATSSQSGVQKKLNSSMLVLAAVFAQRPVCFHICFISFLFASHLFRCLPSTKRVNARERERHEGEKTLIKWSRNKNKCFLCKHIICADGYR